MHHWTGFSNAAGYEVGENGGGHRRSAHDDSRGGRRTGLSRRGRLIASRVVPQHLRQALAAGDHLGGVVAGALAVHDLSVGGVQRGGFGHDVHHDRRRALLVGGGGAVRTAAGTHQRGVSLRQGAHRVRTTLFHRAGVVVADGVRHRGQATVEQGRIDGIQLARQVGHVAIVGDVDIAAPGRALRPVPRFRVVADDDSIDGPLHLQHR